jgi:uncharacterized phiE125 gp8 family phage protein
MYLAQITPPATTPVTLDEAKAQLRVTHSDHDTLITSLIATATQHFAGRHGILGRELINATWDYRCDAFPAVWPYALELPFPPLVSVTSVKYLDGDGVEQTLTATTDYVVETAEFVGRIRPAYNTDWPDTLDDFNAVRVVFVAGFGAASTNIPDPIRAAILLKIEALYTGEELPEATRAIMSLVAPYRITTI